jgi:choline dehydrogenase-like flavoprotein
MNWFNYLIVGSGPAGVAAARRLQGKGTCIIDIGEKTSRPFAHHSLREGLATGDFESVLGHRWEMLSNLVNPNRIHAKLRAAGVRHVMNGQAFKVYDASGELCLDGAASHAAGGMSNVWGAQLLRYTETDLAEVGDWPIDAKSFEPYYADLEAHIGIAGETDDIHEFLGNTTDMLPPAPIVPAAMYLLEQYKKKRSPKKSPQLQLGRSRLAILTQPYRGYQPYAFNETEFFTTEQIGLYTARRTLEELRSAKSVEYTDQFELIAYREYPEFVEADLRHCVSNELKTVRTRHLMLGCGTLQTARIVLLNKNAVGTALPFIDHPPTLVPVFIPRMFGAALPDRSFPVQLVASIHDTGQRDMISFYYPGGLLWSDLLTDMPLPMEAALRILPTLLGCMLVAQIWETSRPLHGNQLTIDSAGQIRIDYPVRKPYAGLKTLLAALRSLGAYSLPHLAKMAPPGWGFHYAACLPMRHRPQAFETHVDGRLWDSRRVRVIDGSVLPSLPAKNHSLTIMANAARIAEETLRCGY